MKKLLSIIVLSLLLSGCVYHDAKVFKNLDHDKGDVRVNLVEGDKEIIYVGLWVGELDYDADQKGIDLGWYTSGYQEEVRRAQPMAIKACKMNFKLNDATKLKSWLTTKEESIKYKLGLKVYDIYKCKKSSEQIYLEREKALSNNTLNRSFTCSFEYDPSEKSKIEIRGNTATETTAVGISINYSIVNLSNKGAFTLEGSSKDGRVWFIGAQSYLILDVNPLPYDCK